MHKSMMQTEQICNHTAVMYATGSRAEGGDNSNEHNVHKCKRTVKHVQTVVNTDSKPSFTINIS